MEHFRCRGYNLPESLPALEDILVALLAQLGTETNVVGLYWLVDLFLLIKPC